PPGQIEAAALPISRQVLRAFGDVAVLLDLARTRNADERRELETLLRGALDQLLQHADQFADRVLPVEFLFVGMAPLLGLPYRRPGEVSGLRNIGQYDPGAHIRSTDIDRQDAVVPLEDP